MTLWHVMARVTFSLDDGTVAQIRQTAARLGKAQSHVVREAVAEYAERAGRLSDRERLHALSVLERLREATPTRSGRRRGPGTAGHSDGAPHRRTPSSRRMIVHVDTSALVDALTGPRRSLDTLIALTREGHRLMLSTIVLYEWLRGPRTRVELAAQEALFPIEPAVPFDVAEAVVASRLYKKVPRARGRETRPRGGGMCARRWRSDLDAQPGGLPRHPRTCGSSDASTRGCDRSQADRP